jgi:hypothetical protein
MANLDDVLTFDVGTYLGDTFFDPIWAELDRRSAVVFIHPGKPAIPITVFAGRVAE